MIFHPTRTNIPIMTTVQTIIKTVLATEGTGSGESDGLMLAVGYVMLVMVKSGLDRD